MRQKAILLNCFSGWMLSTKTYGGMTMRVLVRNKMDLADKAVLENTIVENARLKAMLDYNIMMGNIEDPDEEEGDEDE